MPTPLDGSSGPTPHLSWVECAARPDAAKAAAGLVHLRAHPELWPAMTRVCEVVEVVRGLVDKPVRVTCGLRPGNTPSQHGAGQALDIQVDGLTPRHLLRIIRTAAEQGSLPHPLRQVIAETLHGSSADLDLTMSRGSGRWVHVAVMGVGGEPFTRPSDDPWMLSWAPPGERRAYVWAS